MGFLLDQPGPKIYTTWPNSSPWPSSTGSSFVRTLTANGHRLCYIAIVTLRHCNIATLWPYDILCYFVFVRQKMPHVICPNQFDQIWPNWRPQRAKWFRIDRGWRLSGRKWWFCQSQLKAQRVKSVLFYMETSQEMRMLSRSLSDCQSTI